MRSLPLSWIAMKTSCRPALSAPLHALAIASLITCSAAAAQTHMETVVVTASGAQQAIKEAPASISVITQEDLRKGNYQSVADAVKDVEGVSVVGDTNNTSDISIRGLPGDYTLIDLFVKGKTKAPQRMPKIMPKMYAFMHQNRNDL